MLEKTNNLHKYASQVGLWVKKKKTEIMTLNANNNIPVKIECHELPTTKSFRYLGSILSYKLQTCTFLQKRLLRHSHINLFNLVFHVYQRLKLC